MRRAPICLLLLAACATPRVTLVPSFPVGVSRVYRLVTTATTTIAVSGSTRVDRTELRARSTIDVIGVEAGSTTIRLTLTPQRFTRNGTPGSIQPQQAELTVGLDGTITSIRSVGGVPPDPAGTSVGDLAPLIGAPLPRGPVHVGSRWVRSLDLPGATPTPVGSGEARIGVQHGRVAALERVGGYDCAILSVRGERALSRDFTVDSQPLRLDGTEYSNARISFAFRTGFIAAIVTTAQARFTVQNVPSAGVTVSSTTTLDLLSAR